MIDRYVDAIEHLRANSTRRAQMQRYAHRLVRRYSAERVTVNLYELLTSCTTTGSIAARKACEEHHQRYHTFPNLKHLLPGSSAPRTSSHWWRWWRWWH
jgi:hypothetical protein